MPTVRCTACTRAARTASRRKPAVQDHPGDHEYGRGHAHQQQRLPVHDRLRDTMVRIAMMPVLSDPSAMVKMRCPCGSMNSVLM